MDAWLVDYIEQRRTSHDLLMIAALLWQIWKARNRFVFRQQRPAHLQVMDLAFAQVRTANLSAQSLLRTTRASLQSSMLWRLPEPVIFQRLQHYRARSTHS